MTRAEAYDAMDNRREIQGKNFNEADSGFIIGIGGGRKKCLVEWKSGLTTHAHYENLELK